MNWANRSRNRSFDFSRRRSKGGSPLPVGVEGGAGRGPAAIDRGLPRRRRLGAGHPFGRVDDAGPGFRSRQGERPDRKQYQSRFPDDCPTIAQAFAWFAELEDSLSAEPVETTMPASISGVIGP